RLDFLPFFERSVQNYGVQIDNITYYDSVLDPYINAPHPDNPKAKRVFLFRRDPRDISKIYFLDPADNRYVAIPYRNIGFSAMSAWELKEILGKLKEDGRKDIDENLIFDALDRMRVKIEESKAKTKAARRKATRIPKSAPERSTLRPSPALPLTAMSEKTSPFASDDPFAVAIQPFDEVSLSR
ncbi:MAG: urease subunit beta, partial [Proteobacteria bacterium]